MNDNSPIFIGPTASNLQFVTTILVGVLDAAIDSNLRNADGTSLGATHAEKIVSINAIAANGGIVRVINPRNFLDTVAWQRQGNQLVANTLVYRT